MIEILIVCVCVLLAWCLYITYKAYKFSIAILKMEDNIEECLNILSEKHDSVSKILEKEVFFDSIEVRQVIAVIRESHNAILDVANKLTENFSDDNET